MAGQTLGVTGETDLRAILKTMQPNLSDVEFAFGTVANLEAAEGIEGIVATFLEDEGLSVVAPVHALARAGIPHSPGWARITLTVHSSLAAVGLTAAITSALTD